ncbi:hypothetical protein KFE98_12170 [bacterium SCSIO 12741]|nr:hypothetical protein KFE98_12170 [bacterium SCSIO 12741]
MKRGFRQIAILWSVILLGLGGSLQAENGWLSAPLPTCSFSPGIIPSKGFICEGDTVTLTANTGNYTYQWYKNGTVLTNDTLFNYKASDVGSYKVVITDTALSCLDSATFNLTLGSKPSLLITFSDTAVCDGDEVTLTGAGATSLSWSGGISNGVAFTVTQDNWYYLTGQDVSGCPTQDSIFIHKYDLPTLSVAISDDSICNKDSTRLTASGAQSYIWTQQVNNGINFSPSVTQDYVVIGTDSNGCKSNDTVEVVVFSLPALDLGNDTNICPYDSLQLQAPTGFIKTYLWSDGSTLSSTYVSAKGDHSVMVTDSNDCVVRDTLTLGHDTLPKSYIKAKDTICDGDQYSLSATVVSNYSYLWSKDSISSPFIQLTAAGPYYLTVTDQNGCFQVDTFELEVLALPTMSFTAAIPDQCTNNPPLALSGGSPAGGSYSSSSSMVANDTLWPTQAGTLPIRYTYTDGFQCTNFIDTSVIINDPPVVSLSNLPDLCVNGEVDTLTENSPKGGHFFSTLIWVNDTGYVDPTQNTPGTYQIAYTYTDASIGCSDTAFNTLVIHDTVALSFSTQSWCENLPLQLIGEATGIPANLTGVYTGPSVQSGSWFDPSIGYGSYDLNYQLTDSNSCISKSVRTVSVDSIPSLQFAISNICSNADPVTLTASPSGGTYSGVGLISGDSLDPSIPAVGLNSLSYAYTDASTTCSDTISASYSIYGIPTVLFELPDTIKDQCVESDSVFLSGNSPVGGVFSGIGLTVSNSVFNPDTAGAGTHEIVYTFTDANGCSNSDKDSITVHNRPSLTFAFPDSLCFNNGAFKLTGATPSGVPILDLA